MDISAYLSSGIRDIAGTLARFYLGNPGGRAFLADMAAAVPRSARRRKKHEKAGAHVPPFLICSVASRCNLSCRGCYARANGACGQDADADMSDADWRRVFAEAAALGVSFILLAGGEPLMRPGVLEAAAQTPDVVFPVFTNGTLLDEGFLAFFDRHRRLIPVLSLEGDAAATDERRGSGVHAALQTAMAQLAARGALFGASITVTAQNMRAVTEGSFLSDLRSRGCGIVFFVDYVPAEEGTQELALSDEGLTELKGRLAALRADPRNAGINLLSFPGDEDEMGGCLAAGRGFFHINSRGGAEPCPFSPYSAVNLKDGTLMDALRSPFFARVREVGAEAAARREGGCALFTHREDVLAALQGEDA